MSWKSGNRGRERLVHARLVWRPKTRSRPGFPFIRSRPRFPQETCRRLGEATQAVELCGCEGRVIGFFLPEGDAHGIPPAGLDSPLSAEEIERRRSMRTGRTLDEILRSLDSR